MPDLKQALCIDVGNTAIKAWNPTGVDQHVQLVTGVADLQAFGIEAGEQVKIVSSAPATCAVLRQWLQEIQAQPAEVGKELPIPDLGQYASCGLDRVLAGQVVAAGGGGICLSLGTAATITAWQGHGDTPFAGGLICPGPDACRDGLARAAPALPVALLDADPVQAAQRSTDGALQAGLRIGYLGMLRACIDQLMQETGLNSLWLCGGAAPLYLDALTQTYPLQYRPALVLEGLSRL